jgi:hypothetical protein
MGIHHDFSTRLPQPFRKWEPREARYAVQTATTITTQSGASGAALVSNLSNQGCRIATILTLNPGDRLTLIVEPLGLVEAEVRWKIGDEAGLKLTGRNAHHSDYRLSCAPD